MQKWCPESLAPETAAVFEPVALATADVPAVDPGFRPETGFTDPASLLLQFSREERAQVLALLEQDLRREYEEKARQESRQREEADAARRAEQDQALNRWQDELSAGLRGRVDESIAGLARHAVDMALLMAAKVVRRAVEADPEVLVRNLETVLYKAEAGCALSVTVHPEDAAWLRSAPELRERLRIAEIKEDRRLERGGCLVKAEDDEWDATVERQLAVLGEALQESLSVPAEKPEADDA